MSDLWYIRNTNTIELAALKNDETGVLIDGSYTVRVTMSKGGVNVSGQTWPLALVYNGDAANPRFIGRGSHLLELVDGQEYDLKFEAFSVADDVYGEWNAVVTAKVRGTA